MQGHVPPQGFVQPRRPKKGSGCGSVLVVFCVLFGSCLAVGGLAMVLPKRSPADEKRFDDALDAERKADEARQEAARSAVRKGCRLKPEAPVFVLADDDLRDRCHSLIRESVKVPGSESFPIEGPPALTSDDGCNRIYASQFTAKNAFGVEVRTRYRCTLDPRSGNVSVKTID